MNKTKIALIFPSKIYSILLIKIKDASFKVESKTMYDNIE
jgi:hypothetical protein